MSRIQNHSRLCCPMALRLGTLIVVLTVPLCCLDIPASLRAAEFRPDTAEKLEFNRDIRPILAEKCFKCHGPDAKQRKGKLRLDNRQGATAPAASGSPAIVPGKLDDGELYRRITSDDPDERMPPPQSGKSLSAGDVARIKTWIEQGAEYQGHWAFLPPVRVRPSRRCRIASGAAIRSTSSLSQSWRSKALHLRRPAGDVAAHPGAPPSI